MGTLVLAAIIGPGCLRNQGQAAPPKNAGRTNEVAQPPEEREASQEDTKDVPPELQATPPAAAPPADARPQPSVRARKLPEAPAATVRVGTWNLLQLGNRKTKRIKEIAGLIERELDVVAVQEVMKPEAIQALLQELPGWRATISDKAVGRKAHKEHYAVLYRADLLTVERAYLADDPDDRFEREPYVACLRAQVFDFCLLTIHVVYGDSVGPRDVEITVLAELADGLRVREGERDWIVLGDFNREPNRPCWGALRQAGWQNAADSIFGTTLGKNGYSKPYDHILIDPDATRELAEMPRRIDIVAALCVGDFAVCRAEVSDHAPVATVFRISGSDDD